MKLLVVEDDTIIASGLTYSLENEGFDVTYCENVRQATQAISKEPFDLCLLDVSLPDGTGYELCRKIRQGSDTPVIFLTAHADEANVVMGLDMGADDYIAKPFRLRELLSRIQSVLRRYNKDHKSASLFTYKDLRVNTKDAKVYKGETEILLTALEYRLLLVFINHLGQVLSRDQLLDNIWDVAGDFVNDNTLTVYIKRIRDKLEDNPQDPQLIKTIRGLGYKLGD